MLRILTVHPVVPRAQRLGRPTAITSVTSVAELAPRVAKVWPDVVILPAGRFAPGEPRQLREVLPPEALLCVAANPTDGAASFASEDLGFIGAVLRTTSLEDDLLRALAAHTPAVEAEAAERQLMRGNR